MLSGGVCRRGLPCLASTLHSARTPRSGLDSASTGEFHCHYLFAIFVFLPGLEKSLWVFSNSACLFPLN